MSRPLAAIVQEQVYAYRVPFFRHLRDELDARGIDFRLVYDHEGSSCHDLDREPWSVHTPTRRFGKLTWQNLGKACRGSDLLVIQQQVRYPASLLELLRRRLLGRKVAFWGHGKCFAEGWEERPGEKFKAWVSRHVDWWFAYNGRSADVVRALGYPAERITSVMNAVDTRRMAARRAELKEEDLQALRDQLGLHSANVCVYTGTLYVNKRLDFLIEAAVEIRRRIPDFELLVIGSGPDEGRIREVAAPYPWIRFLGRKDDVEKVPYWALSKLLLMPGGVGLVILDSFAIGVPLVTTDTPLHGPEIEYLKLGENGLLVECGDSVEVYANEVVRLLENNSFRERLAICALADGQEYTVENMAKRFADGIRSALDTGSPD